LPENEQAKVFAYIGELKKQGHNLRRPLSAPVESGLYELRPQDNRLFYFFFHKDYAIFVHAIKKKTNKIPNDDIKLSLKRKRIIENSESNIEGE